MADLWNNQKISELLEEIENIKYLQILRLK